LEETPRQTLNDEASFAQLILGVLSDETTAAVLYHDPGLRRLTRELLAVLPNLVTTGTARRAFVWCSAFQAVLVKSRRDFMHEQKLALECINDRLMPIAVSLNCSEREEFLTFLESVRGAAQVNPRATIELVEFLSDPHDGGP
jgi:hypothetical protein